MSAVASETPKPVHEQGTTPAPARLTSLDAYRGLVMLLMMAEALSLWRVAQAMPGSAFWKFLAHHQSHAEWIGCSLHDLIQPSFSFLVGVALPFSLASRAARGQSAHADDAARRVAGAGAHPAGRLSASSASHQDLLGLSKTRSAKSGWVMSLFSCSAFGPCATSGLRWGSFWPAIGRPLRSTRCPVPDFDYAQSGRAEGLAASA